MPTPTGSRADHRLAVTPSRVESVARAISAALASGATGGNDGSARFNASEQKWIAAVARDLRAHRGRSLVIAGDHQPPAVHAIAHAMNDALGNAGSTVVFTQTTAAEPVDQLTSLRSLVEDMNAGRVDVLVIVGANPVYTAPADFGFAAALN